MEPRQLRLPGFTRSGASEFRHIRIRQRNPRRAVRQRIFVAVGAIEQDDPLVLPDQPALQRAAPSRDHRAAFRAQQHAVVARDILDRLDDRLLLDRDRPRPRFREPRAGSGNRRPPWERGFRWRWSPPLPSARRIPRPPQTPARSARSPPPGPRTSAAARARSVRSPPARRSPSTCRSGRFRRRSGRRSRRAIASPIARQARAP